MRTRPQQCFDTELFVRRPEDLHASVSRTSIFIMPTLASVCSTGGRLQRAFRTIFTPLFEPLVAEGILRK